MAITASNILRELRTTNFANASASFTPADNSLLVVRVSGAQSENDNFDGSLITLANSASLSQTLRATSALGVGWTYGTRVWTIPVTTGVSMTVTPGGFGGAPMHDVLVEVYQFTGIHATTPVGAIGNEDSVSPADGADTCTLNATPASTSYVIAFAHHILSGGSGATTQGSGWTEHYDNFVTDYSVYHTQGRTGFTSTGVPWVDLNTSNTGFNAAHLVAIEVVASAGGGGSYTLTAEQGTLSLTGQTATTKVGRVVTGAQGTYSLSGQVANLVKDGVDITLTAETGTYTILGSDGFADYVIAANFETYNLAGQQATLARDYTMLGSFGTYSLSGQDASLLWSGSGPKIIVADSGTYTLSGQSNNLRRAAKLVSERGLYSINGFTVVGGASADSGTSTGIGPLKVRKVLVVSTSGRTKWVNYIPVKQVGVSTGAAGRTDNGGAIEVELIGSGTGLTEWIDYIPVVEVGDGEEYRWRYDNSGWLPIIVVE